MIIDKDLQPTLTRSPAENKAMQIPLIIAISMYILVFEVIIFDHPEVFYPNMQ